MTRQYKNRRRVRDGARGASFATPRGADIAGKRYLAQCRDEARPEHFYVISKREGGGRLRHYPVLVVADDKLRAAHQRRSGFAVDQEGR